MVAVLPICTPFDKAEKSAALHQGGAALVYWTQGRFMVDRPEGLILTEHYFREMASLEPSLVYVQHKFTIHTSKAQRSASDLIK